MNCRKQGFTLIELLVVIAIIAILAAMLFPVFARARESARKIQCLSNVKNIATAIQMYLTDYDRMPPSEHRPEIVSFYDDLGCNGHVQGAKNNPYLKWQVLLDEYTKNRDVWRCPSARYTMSVRVLNPMGGDWWARVQDLWSSAGGGCSPFAQCGSPYPPGWGGSVTDSYLQQACGGVGAFERGINGLNENMDLKTSQIDDPAKWLAVCESGAGNDTWSTFIIAYPDMCKLGCATLDTKYGTGCTVSADWVNCSWSQDCGAGDPRLGEDVQLRKQWARHLGGVNLGFADGHAAWMSSESVLHGGRDYRWFIPESQKQPTTALAITGPVGLCMSPDL
jgi:prepilin-type N-terminal cleavage/methylation domain-containing protein/prepilin-type processing-associated H-X9-DG protein